MVDLQDKNLRELNNRLAGLNVKMVTINSDLKRIIRREETHELEVRRLKKDIQKMEMELSLLVDKKQKFSKEEFKLKSDKRFLKKQIEAVMAEIRSIKNVTNNY